MSSSLISIQEATFGYARDAVLTSISFDVRVGDFIGIAGPNGSGKTTLLKACIGLLKPQKGRVVFHELSKHLGYVPQRDQLDSIYPLTVRDVVELGLVANRPWWRLRLTTDARDIMNALDWVGLTDLSKASFGSLSGGQRQRVLMARALVTNPDLLVLDEPMAGIDRHTEMAVLSLLSRLHSQHNKTILMVSHHVDQIKTHVTRLVSVDEGGLDELSL